MCGGPAVSIECPPCPADTSRSFNRPRPRKSKRGQSSSLSHRSTRSSCSVSSSLTGGTSIASDRGLRAESLREEGRALFINGDYREAIQLFTQAIGAYAGESGPGCQDRVKRILARLYGYRGSALFLIGAFEAAARDGELALQCGENCARSPLEQHLRRKSKWLHPEKGSVLRSKILARMGYALLRTGVIEGVKEAFEGAIKVSKETLEEGDIKSKDGRPIPAPHRQAIDILEGSIKCATQGLEELQRYEQLEYFLSHLPQLTSESIPHLDAAMAVAPANDDWYVEKAEFLAGQKRWFEITNLCEQMAAEAAKFDGLYALDLGDLDPYPCSPPAKELKPDFFDDDKGSKGKKSIIVPAYLRSLSDAAVREAVLRMPAQILPYYLRALRFDGRFSAATEARAALKSFAKNNPNARPDIHPRHFHEEWYKLQRTIHIKSEADIAFSSGLIEQSMTLISDCSVIDTECIENNHGANGALQQSSSPGGALHANLHYSLADCFFLLGQYHDAVTECTNALSIHDTYMSAILKRARSHVKLRDFKKAKEDYNLWLSLVSESRVIPFPRSSKPIPCYFDTPIEISAADFEAVNREKVSLSTRKGEVLKTMGRMFRHSNNKDSRDIAAKPEKKAKDISKTKVDNEATKNVDGKPKKNSKKPRRSDNKQPARSVLRRPQCARPKICL